VLALSAFRMAKGTMKERITAAEDAVYRGAGQYAAWNAPPVFNHKVARLALQFKKYPQRIMSNYIEAVAGSLKGDTKKMGQLAYMLGTQAMVAGLFGLPTEVFSVGVNAINIASGGVTPNWEDIQRGVYTMMAKYAGPEFAEIIAHGLPRLAGVEASSRLGHDSLMFFGSPKSTRPEDIKTSIASVVLGAGGSTIEGLLNGSQHIVQAAAEAANGSYSRAGALARQAAREMIPIRQVADIYDAYRKSTGDMSARTRGGALLGPEYTAGDAFWRAIGFTPAREARGQEQSRAERRVNTLAQTDRKAWLDRYATATAAERPSIEAGIRQFNAGQPATQRIGSADMVRAVSQRRTQERRPGSELGLPLNRRTRDLHQEYSQLYMTGR